MASKKAKRKPGRPAEAVPADIADAVVEWISAGKTMRAFCAQEGMPCRQTIDKWKAKDEAFRGRIARARDDGHDCLADGLLELAKKPVSDALELQRRKFEADTTLKLLAKWDRRYSDKMTLAGDPDAPVAPMSDTERMAKLTSLMDSVRRRLQKSGD